MNDSKPTTIPGVSASFQAALPKDVAAYGSLSPVKDLTSLVLIKAASTASPEEKKELAISVASVGQVATQRLLDEALLLLKELDSRQTMVFELESRFLKLKDCHDLYVSANMGVKFNSNVQRT